MVLKRHCVITAPALIIKIFLFPTTSFLTTTNLIYTHGAGITAAAGHCYRDCKNNNLSKALRGEKSSYVFGPSREVDWTIPYACAHPIIVSEGFSSTVGDFPADCLSSICFYHPCIVTCTAASCDVTITHLTTDRGEIESSRLSRNLQV